MARSPSQSGFTLIEMLITVGTTAVLMAVFAPLYQSIVSAQDRAASEKNRLYNQYVGNAFLSFARNTSTTGSLPAPYTGGGYTGTVYNSGDVTAAGIALTQALSQQGLPPNEINDDGTAGASVRVYQQVTGLSQQVPLYGRSGPLVTLTYQYGAIYMSGCEKASSTCNPTAATGIPGSSVALTSTNYNTWTTSGTDGAPYIVSTLPVQKDMLVTTANRLDKLRERLLSEFVVKQQSATAGDTTNFFPVASASLAGQTPATNQGCRDGWYSLATSTVLNGIGLAASEYGATAWGGAIEYCRDYDPAGTSGANVVPHYAALRIRANVSAGVTPDSVVSGNNVVLTF